MLPYSLPGFQSVIFEVNDPAQLDDIVSQLKENDAIDWRAYKVETDNKTYLAAAAPLEKSQTLIISFLLLIVLVSAVVLSLILTMWAKSRIHETGVLLSIGFGKASIIGQYLTEVLLIAAIAFGLSFFPAASSQAGSETACCSCSAPGNSPYRSRMKAKMGYRFSGRVTGIRML